MTCSSAACNNVREILFISQILHCLKTTVSLKFKVLLEIHESLTEGFNRPISRGAKPTRKTSLLMLCAGLAVKSSGSLL